MTGCADWAASAALLIAVPLPANRLPDHNHGRGTCDHHLCPRSNGARFPVWPEPGTSTDGPGATCCHDAPAAPHLAFATPINLGYLYIAGNRTGSRITAR